MVLCWSSCELKISSGFGMRCVIFFLSFLEGFPKGVPKGFLWNCVGLPGS